MDLALFVDFGSTYTKVTVVDLKSEELKATALSGTTVETDIMLGLQNALDKVYPIIGYDARFRYKMSCSSAAGGLKIVAIGLVKSLTAEAAKRAALGAGAKILDVFAHELTEEDVNKIHNLSPDIILLAGGTDGGNKEVILFNAKMLCKLPKKVPIVIAGNKVAAPVVQNILINSGFEAVVAENVMPELNVLNVEPVKKVIRELFLKRITLAKGLKRAEKFVDGVLMPTPAAVLKAAELLAKGTSNEPGLGELMVIDPGGATTDVYSIASGAPTKAGVILKGLPEPEAKRTVEGDLGMRYSSKPLFEAAVENKRVTEHVDELREYVEKVSKEPCYLPKCAQEVDCDITIAKLAVEEAVKRHVGYLEIAYTPFGVSYLQYGKDLTQISHVVGTGGILVNHENPFEILSKALFENKDITVLKPQNAQLWIDKEYILSSMGLLSEVDEDKALRIMKKYLTKLGGC